MNTQILEVTWATRDQPLFALPKIIHWRLSDIHGFPEIHCVSRKPHGHAWDRFKMALELRVSWPMSISRPLALLHLVHIVPTSLVAATLTQRVCVLYMLFRDSYQEYINLFPVGSQLAMEKYELLVLQFVRSVRSGNKSL